MRVPQRRLSGPRPNLLNTFVDQQGSRSPKICRVEFRGTKKIFQCFVQHFSSRRARAAARTERKTMIVRDHDLILTRQAGLLALSADSTDKGSSVEPERSGRGPLPASPEGRVRCLPLNPPSPAPVHHQTYLRCRTGAEAGTHPPWPPRLLRAEYPATASSNQAGWNWRRPRPEWQFGLMQFDCHALQVRQDLRDDLRLLDAGNDLERPPQRAQLSISMPKTRLSRRAQLIATCLGVGGSACERCPGCFAAPRPLRAGVTAARNLLCGANTP